MKVGIATKISTLAIMLVILTALSVGYLVYRGSSALLVEQELNNFSENIRQHELKVQLEIGELRDDVLFLSKIPPVQGIVRTQNNAKDPNDGSSQAVWIERLYVIFENFLQSNPDYSQIRFIGLADQGREIVRVDRSNDKVFRVEKEDLQQKGRSGYFRKAIEKVPGRKFIYQKLSLIGKKELLQRHMIRYCALQFPSMMGTKFLALLLSIKVYPIY